MLKADLWRDHLLKEEALLNAKSAKLEKEGGNKRFEDARKEAAMRPAYVCAQWSDMDAENGPSWVTALLAGESSKESSRWAVLILSCRS